MQVAAYTNGRDVVSVYDCLLLQHVLWNRPDEAERIADWMLGQLANDNGMQQMQYLLSGMFGRACKALSKDDELVKIREVGSLVGGCVGGWVCWWASFWGCCGGGDVAQVCSFC